MTSGSCELLWMAEAGDDGRLPDEQQATFRRHAQSCDVCAQALASVERLRATMCAIPAPPLDDFQCRRQRQRLLARADELQTAVQWPFLTRGRLTAFVSLAVVLASVGAWRMLSGLSAVSESPPRYEVTALEGATWRNEEVGGTARIVLSRGSAAFHVHHLSTAQRFLVTLPDAEVEVRGTRFVVDVEGGQTRYVVVIEGKVAFRRAGAQEQLLLGGQRWDAPGVVAAATVVSPPEPSPTPAGEVATRSAAAEPVVALPSRRPIHPALRPALRRRDRRVALAWPALSSPSSVTPPPSVAAAPSSPPPSSAAPTTERSRGPTTDPGLTQASDLFARGVRAFRSHRYDEAEAAWQAFLAENANDPRAEDAAFLRAVGRSRLGDARGAAALARRYLERFPRGMRRREAEALMHPVPQNPTENQ